MILRGHKLKRGFTLVEIIVVSAIVGILLSCFIIFFLMGFHLWYGGEARIELQQEMRNAMAWITNDLQQAGSSSIIDVPADGNQYPAISFRVCSGVSAGKISWSNNPIGYIINANQLLRIEGGTNIAISENTQSLQFRRQRDTPNIVEVSLVLAKTSDRGTFNDSLNFRVKLRN
jgi:prepilin-type N-terminal cleavage/methylation domain-containing protein